METQYTAFIERYFDGLLSPKEVEELNRLRQTDEAFQEEFELFEQSHKAVELSTIIGLKAEIADLHKNMEHAPSSKPLPWLRISIAASILFLIGTGFYAQQFSNENLYAAAYLPVGDYITNMDGEVSALEAALELFDQQQFEEAGTAFETIYNQTGDQVALFYAGHCQYQAGEWQAAIETLSTVSNNYRAEAQWYVALAYLKLDDIENTLGTLDAILEQQEDATFVLKASQLKDDLNSPLRYLVW